MFGKTVLLFLACQVMRFCLKARAIEGGNVRSYALSLRLCKARERMEMVLKDKVAIVLGASAEAGSGWAVAKRYAAEGAKVVVAARRAEPLQKLAAEIDGAWITCDVAKEDEVKALVDFAMKTYGRIDVACNAAGLPMGGTISNAPMSDVREAMEVDYFGCVYFVRHVAEAMKQGGPRKSGGYGSIVLFSSMTTTHMLESVYPYACAKAAADCLVVYAAAEYGPFGIKVNSILPGPIRSEMSTPLWQVPGMEEAWSKDVPLGRLGLPEDFADAALWLAGPSFVTGLNLQVSGGNQVFRFPRLSERPEIEGYDPTNAA